MVGAVIMNNGNVYYASSGVSGSVSVTVTPGKIAAVLTNVAMDNVDFPQDTAAISGTPHEQ